jgi:TonB family protein
MKRTDELWRLVVMAMIGILTLVQVEQAKGNDGGTPLEALRTLVTAALAAVRAGDRPKMEEIARSMMLPNYEAWFRAKFGEEAGTKLSVAYRRDFNEKQLSTFFTSLAKQEGEVLVDEERKPQYPSDGFWCGGTLLAVKSASSFYLVRIRYAPQKEARRLTTVGYFSFVEGNYRLLDCTETGFGVDNLEQPLPGSRTLRVSSNVQSARILYRVAPVYPKEAREQRVSGTVRLHILVAEDGTVENLEVVSGPPLLQQPSLDAVERWVYSPALLGNEPLKVDTTVDLIFAL